MDILLLLWTAVLKCLLQRSFVYAQCTAMSSKPNPLQLTEEAGQIAMTSPARKTRKCYWKFPRMEKQQAIIVFLEKANMRVGNTKRCAGQIILPGSRQCFVSNQCRVFTHDNSTCSLAYMTSQRFTQCNQNVITSDNSGEIEVRFVLSTSVPKKITFNVKYKIIDCPENKNDSNDSIPYPDTGTISNNSFFKRHLIQTNITTTAYTTDASPDSTVARTDEISDYSDKTQPAAVYAMIAVILILFICLVAVSVKLLLGRMRKTNSSFHNPTVVAYVHQEQQGKAENEPDRHVMSESIDSIPSNTALYAEIGSGTWNANQEIHQYLELPQPSNSQEDNQPVNSASTERKNSTENRNSTESRHSMSFPDYIYSKVNMLKKKRATSNSAHKEARTSDMHNNSAEL